jgi:short subunit dehydrogenase-like uncharacterized protein
LDNVRRVLVLGASGLAGRVVVERLMATTDLEVVATGRNAASLRARFGGRDPRLTTATLDADDGAAVRQACASVDVVVNAVGPYTRNGADIARTVVDCRRHYIDCANEQLHFERLQALDARARAVGCLLLTGAGLFPGLSSLLAAHQLRAHPDADSLEIVYAQLRSPFDDGGHASAMGGVLDAVLQPWAVRDGRRVPVPLGHSLRTADLPPPFGRRRLLEVPTLDVPLFADRPGLCEIHTWVLMTDQPAWVFGLIRRLDPSRRPWAYRLLDGILSRLARREAAHAEAAGLSRNALLQVITRDASRESVANLVFCDGASPVGALPARIARDLAAGRIAATGLQTPLDLYTWEDVADEIDDCLEPTAMSGGS